MDKNLKLQKALDARTDRVWVILCEMYPKLVRFNPPVIRTNYRLWRTAGRCFQAENRIDLGAKFLLHSDAYCRTMFSVILPHEIIHQADFNLYGESEKICGHGAKWSEIMLQYGLPDNVYHSMLITRK